MDLGPVVWREIHWSRLGLIMAIMGSEMEEKGLWMPWLGGHHCTQYFHLSLWLLKSAWSLECFLWPTGDLFHSFSIPTVLLVEMWSLCPLPLTLWQVIPVLPHCGENTASWPHSRLHRGLCTPYQSSLSPLSSGNQKVVWHNSCWCLAYTMVRP